MNGNVDDLWPEPEPEPVPIPPVAEVIQLHPEVVFDPADPDYDVKRLTYAMRSKSEVVLAGVAGTGKTTLVSKLLESGHLDGRPVYLIAPTGRAARRLSQVTGSDAQTIHSFAYDAPTEHWIKPDGEECKDPNRPCLGCTCSMSMSWSTKRQHLERGAWIVVDEASMVDGELADALRSKVAELNMGLGILWVGDPAQLPPVNGDPGVDLGAPDVLLEKVHRTEEPGILDFCTIIRTAVDPEDLLAVLDHATEFDGVSVGSGGWSGAAAFRACTDGSPPQDRNPDHRMLIVGRNKDRIDLNARVRTAIRFRDRLQVGDRVIVRENSRDTGAMRGEIYRIGEIEVDGTGRVALANGRDLATGKERSFVVVLETLDTTDTDAFRRGLRNWPNPWWDKHLVNVQYGYALTCHAAQGCEADDVGVVWTGFDTWRLRKDFEDTRAWLYTAATRARRSLKIWRLS